MISEICAELHNYFLRDYISPEQYIHEGVFVIANGEIQSLPFLADGQYYRIIGSRFNDGVWRYGAAATRLTDETFEGTIWEMFIPPEFVSLSNEIDAWNAANAAIIASPFQSESWAGYSYTKASGADGRLSTDWRTHFDSRLKRWRRLKDI